MTLGNTTVTDAGLERLRGLGKLSTLSLEGTPVSDAGVEGLQKALPALRIHR